MYISIFAFVSTMLNAFFSDPMIYNGICKILIY